jgi:hypothetical protein
LISKINGTNVAEWFDSVLATILISGLLSAGLPHFKILNSKVFFEMESFSEPRFVF